MSKQNNNQEPDLIKDALEKAGKSQEEIDIVSQLDKAQDKADEHRLKTGVLQTALLERTLPLSLFAVQKQQADETMAAQSLANCLTALQGKPLFDGTGKVAPEVIGALSEAGYWGLPIEKKYGGSGASKRFLAKAMLEVGSKGAEVLGGLLSIERLIGAAGPLMFRGTEAQKQEFLPSLADGTLRSGFGGTEPAAGCNITKITTYGIDSEDGENILVYGDKLFISNAWYGHLIALLIRYKDCLRVLLVKLPDCDSEEFNIVNYEIHALRQIHNKGLHFNGLKVPAKNLLPGDGLSLIFHDLDDGRFAVAATAAVRMRRILASCIPWVNSRITFGVKLKERQYIKHLLAMQGAYIAGSEALVYWAASLIDSGFQGDVSSMITKTRATDWLRDISTNYGMFTHGGRFVLKGHTIGDNLADDMVASVYEGPNPMLGKAAVKAVSKAFAETYLKPILSGKNSLWAKMKAIASLSLYFTRLLAPAKAEAAPAELPTTFKPYLSFALAAWRRWRISLIYNLIKYQEKMADEDLVMLEAIYEPLTAITSLFVAINAAAEAAKEGDAAKVDALSLLCMEMRIKLAPHRFKRTDSAYKALTEKVAEHILAGRFQPIEGVPQGTILQPYYQ
ncbi:MAG: acyl-CoA/acyl-ACP dehydrogenase [Candidatus Obscuribacterales bacterium]|nr:acyl-CoA/acyl-ACP dehydrogenase [Candidatus Obscuribacterales bacterium]